MDFNKKFSKGPKQKTEIVNESNLTVERTSSNLLLSTRRSRRFRLEKWSKLKSKGEASTSSRTPPSSIVKSESNLDSDQEEVWNLLELDAKEYFKLEINSPLPTTLSPTSRQTTTRNFSTTTIKTLKYTEMASSPKKVKSTTSSPTKSGADSTPPSLPPTGSSVRKWSETRLGEETRIGSRKLTSDEFQFTVLSYNVLSDKLMKNHPELYTGKSDEVLNWEPRWNRLRDEILTLEIDILCLQEVDYEHYESHFVPSFREHGFKGIYKKRTHDKNDGCAIFYKDDQLELRDWTSIEFYQPGINSLDRDNIGILAKFRPRKRSFDDSSTFCVATTHLLFNPKRHDVKLAQVALLLAELDRFAFCGSRPADRRLGGQSLPDYHPVILTGDFNMTPDSPVYEFIQSGFVEYSGMTRQLQQFGSGNRLTNYLFPPQLGITDQCQHVDVSHDRPGAAQADEPTRLFHSQRGEGKERKKAAQAQNFPPNVQHLFGSGTLSHSFGFRSAYKQYQFGKSVTSNHQDGYGTVDYLFFSTVFSQRHGNWVEGNLKLLSRLNLLSGKEVQILGGLPSMAFPSDHLCLVAKFLLRRSRK